MQEPFVELRLRLPRYHVQPLADDVVARIVQVVIERELCTYSITIFLSRHRLRYNIFSISSWQGVGLETDG